MDIEKEDSNSASAYVGIFLHSLHGQQNTFISTMSYSISIYYHNSVNCDRPGECSPEKDCLR